jgi:proteic killer suppression protein
MQLQFAHEYLEELYYTKRTTSKKHRFQPAVVAGYVKGVAHLERVDALDELRKVRGLHFEPLKGDKFGLYSIRANDKYRVEFAILQGYYNGETVDRQAVICNIVDLSNHYKK